MKGVMYHYVRPDSSGFPHFKHLRRDNFARQLDFFEKEHRPCTHDELLRAIREQEVLSDTVILTFDDGLKDHYRYVFPELKNRGVVGVFYVPTSPLQTGEMLEVHRVHLLLGRHGGEIVWTALNALIKEEMLVPTEVKKFREVAYKKQVDDELSKEVKRTLNYYIDYGYRKAVLDALMKELVPEERSLAEDFYLTVDEMREMQQAGMVIGSHTVSHPCLSKINLEDQEAEIHNSFRFLESALGKPPIRTFCYPYGGFHSFSAETESILRRHDCEFAFNVEARDITKDDLVNRPLALPRYACNAFPHGNVVPPGQLEG